MTAVFDYSQFPTITTERLKLRRLAHSDADAIVGIFGSPEVLRFLSQPLRSTREQAVELVDWFDAGFVEQKGVQWGITRHGDDPVIGTCGFYAWDQTNRKVDIGYQFTPSAWGKGYATEAAQGIIRWCFANLDVHRIQADCTAGNDASERVMTKCGFRFEGVWRESCWEHGRFVDIKQFGLLRHEFQ